MRWLVLSFVVRCSCGFMTNEALHGPVPSSQTRQIHMSRPGAFSGFFSEEGGLHLPDGQVVREGEVLVGYQPDPGRLVHYPTVWYWPEELFASYDKLNAFHSDPVYRKPEERQAAWDKLQQAFNGHYAKLRAAWAKEQHEAMVASFEQETIPVDPHGVDLFRPLPCPGCQSDAMAYIDLTGGIGPRLAQTAPHQWCLRMAEWRPDPKDDAAMHRRYGFGHAIDTILSCPDIRTLAAVKDRLPSDEWERAVKAIRQPYHGGYVNLQTGHLHTGSSVRRTSAMLMMLESQSSA